jgi:hypothetical protein
VAGEPLLCNYPLTGGYTGAVSRQRLGKHVPAETNTHATIEELLETKVFVGPCRDVMTETIGATK